MATTTTTTTTAPRVYVGTYAKYNSGNLSGAWIDLTSCDNYEAFLRQCAAVHKDEQHPEFMIQDCDNFPDGLSCMEWLDKCEFDDIKAALTASDDEDNTDNDNKRISNAGYIAVSAVELADCMIKELKGGNK